VRLRVRISLALAATVLLAAITAGAALSKAGTSSKSGSSTTSTPLTGTPVPPGFVGVDAGGPLFNDGVNLGQQFSTMVADGVQSVRVVFNWAQAQPQQGGPIDFSATDKVVALAASRGLTVLPTVLYAPGWDAGKNSSGGLPPPAQTVPYANYLIALIDRYGPHGTFWSSHHPKRPIRMWQIWNEPNLSSYWPQPFAKSYVNLLRTAHTAIKRADPGAKVVLGALTNTAWKYVGQIYKIAGARKLFDVVAVNGFTSTPANVITFLQLMRRALNRLGDPNKPLLATELSWPSSLGKVKPRRDWDTSEHGQASDVAELLPMLAAHRAPLHLAGFYYYTWVSQQSNPGRDDFNFAGLSNYVSAGKITAKPALLAYRSSALALEHCRRKGAQATSCVKS
jgi:hypothetical protein